MVDRIPHWALKVGRGGVVEVDWKLLEEAGKGGARMAPDVQAVIESGAGRRARGRESAQELPGGMNKLEARYATEVLELERRAGSITWWRFEPWGLRLADRTFYHPDFVFQLNSTRELYLVDVKGHWEDDARVKIKVAAALWPCFHWEAVSWNRDESVWSTESIEPRRSHPLATP